MRVRLTRKFADVLDGIDLRCRQVGDIVDLPDDQAQLLIAEAWATARSAKDELQPQSRSAPPNPFTANEKKERA